MAKSIRSKRRRKMRAIKRERYGKKELDRLKKTLGIEETQTNEVNMEEIAEVVTFITPAEVNKKKTVNANDTDIMDVLEVNNIKKFNPKTLRNENGAYPIWVHPRKSRKARKVKRKVKTKGKVTKQSKRARASSN